MKERLLHITKIYVILLVVFISYYFINKYTGLYIPCYFRLITGFKCPGCGITSCLFAIVHLDFKEAYNYNPLVFIYLPFVVAYFIYMSYLYVYDKKDEILIKIPNYLKVMVLVVTILYGIIRNIK